MVTEVVSQNFGREQSVAEPENCAETLVRLNTRLQTCFCLSAHSENSCQSFTIWNICQKIFWRMGGIGVGCVVILTVQYEY